MRGRIFTEHLLVPGSFYISVRLNLTASPKGQYWYNLFMGETLGFRKEATCSR